MAVTGSMSIGFRIKDKDVELTSGDLRKDRSGFDLPEKSSISLDLDALADWSKENLGFPLPTLSDLHIPVKKLSVNEFSIDTQGNFNMKAAFLFDQNNDGWQIIPGVSSFKIKSVGFTVSSTAAASSPATPGTTPPGKSETPSTATPASPATPDTSAAPSHDADATKPAPAKKVNAGKP